ncbi:7989_t:CDS:2, partial [Funneliformis geosporum]
MLLCMKVLNCNNSFDDKFPNTSCNHADAVNLKDLREKLPKLTDIKCVRCDNENGVKIGNSPPEPGSTDTSERTEGADIQNEDLASSKDAENPTNPIIWLCLICCESHCGRNDKKHAIMHYENNKEHALSINFEDLSIWCYECDTTPTENDVLSEAQKTM